MSEAGKEWAQAAGLTVVLMLAGGNIVHAQEQAKSADAFVETIGVCTHWSYPDTPYGFAYEKVKQKLVEAGIRHVRDGLNNRIVDLGRAGIKSAVVAEPDLGTPEAIRDKIKAINRITPAVDAVEGPNEPDLFWASGKKSYRGQGYVQGATGIMQGVIAFQKDLFAAFRGDPETARLKLIGPALGKTYGYETKSPLGKGTLTDFVDYGNFHPYCFGGNSFSVPFPYDTLAKYYWHGNFPTVNLEEFPAAFDIYAPPFAPRPMAATETGYSTWRDGTSEQAHARYMPRLFCEYFRRGIARTYSYEFVDEFEDKAQGNMEAHFGLLRRDLTPRPAYAALKSLISVLQEKGVRPSFRPGALNYDLSVQPPPGYDRTQYVHHLLLQKSDGDFYLVLWHEISVEDTSVKPHRQISPPDMPVTLRFRTPLQRAMLFTYNSAWELTPSAAPLRENTLHVNVPDRVVVLRLTPAAR